MCFSSWHARFGFGAMVDRFSEKLIRQWSKLFGLAWYINKMCNQHNPKNKSNLLKSSGHHI